MSCCSLALFLKALLNTASKVRLQPGTLISNSLSVLQRICIIYDLASVFIMEKLKDTLRGRWRKRHTSSNIENNQLEPSQSSPEGSPQPFSFPDGVEVLHECPDATVDICFVHGLTGNRDSTWIAHGQSTPWPKTLLPLEFDRARILTYGYDAYIVRKFAAWSINPPEEGAVRR